VPFHTNTLWAMPAPQETRSDLVDACGTATL
jgi:hypothetical protein